MVVREKRVEKNGSTWGIMDNYRCLRLKGPVSSKAAIEYNRTVGLRTGTKIFVDTPTDDWYIAFSRNAGKMALQFVSLCVSYGWLFAKDFMNTMFHVK